MARASRLWNARRRLGRRAGTAMSVAAMSSIGNFVLSVGTSHAGSIAQLGQFVLAFSAYVMATGLVRATVAEAVFTSTTTAAGISRGSQRASLVGFVAATITCTAGLAVGSAYLLVLGLALPGLLMYEYLKVMSLAGTSPTAAVARELAWTVMSVVGVAIGAVGLHDPLVIFGVWAGSGAVIGIGGSVHQRFRVAPRWTLGAADTRQALSFGAQYLVASGTAQIAVVALAATGGAAVVGAVGAAKVVLGPVSLALSAVGLVIVPYLARRAAASPAHRLRSTGRITLVAVVPAAVVAIGCALVPDPVGILLTGDNWTVARPLVGILAVECVFALASSIPFAGHRIERAGPRALLLGSLMGVGRVGLLAWAGLAVGALGVAYVMTAIAALTVVVWWGSYFLLLRRQVPAGRHRAGRSPRPHTSEVVSPAEPAGAGRRHESVRR